MGSKDLPSSQTMELASKILLIHYADQPFAPNHSVAHWLELM